MEPGPKGRIALLWRGDREARKRATTENNMLRPVFEALARLNVAAEPAVYSEETADDVRDQLWPTDGVLVWVDPISDGKDRSKLDALLREVSSNGVWVSAHPDVILKMGTKEVLYRTRHLGWGTDTRLYRTAQEFKDLFPALLASSDVRVLKQYRGNGGIGTFKVELVAPASGTPRPDALVHVHEARRGGAQEDLRLGDLMARCEKYFENGCLIDQAFQPRVADGMVRCYLSQGKVAGFSTQSPRNDTAASGHVSAFAMAREKTMYDASEPRFQRLRANMESEWVPAMMEVVGVKSDDLPAIWDADFLYGPKTPDGEDTYVLCEINISAVFPFPPQAIDKLAHTAVECMLSAKKTRSGGTTSRRH